MAAEIGQIIITGMIVVGSFVIVYKMVKNS